MKRSILLALAMIFALNNFGQMISNKNVPKNVQKEFNNLTTTRRKQLDRQVNKIEDLRKQEGIAESIPVQEEQDSN